MKKAKGLYAKIEHDAVFHKTSIGRNPSKCKMNKHKRRSFKKISWPGLTNILNYPIFRI
jgi:hypothetical protein